jgi:hypothetical protein
MYIKKTAEQVLLDLITTLTQNLEEIGSQQRQTPFALGEVYAYTECLEIIQMWKKAKFYGLDYDLEKRYKIG